MESELTDEEQKALEAEKKKLGPSQPVTIKLRKPLPIGKEETTSELVLKPLSRAFKELTVKVGINEESGEKTMHYTPYELAKVGLKMAGHFATAHILVDQLDPKDLSEVSSAALGFFV